MEAVAGANGGVCISFSTMGFGLGFNNPKFSDRVLKILVIEDSSDSQNSKGSSSSSASSCRVTTVYMNSLVLASQSPFFHKMFSNGMKESEQQEVTISVMSSEEFALLDLLEFMYTHKLKADTDVELLKVLVLADRYQVAACVTFCAEALSTFPMSFHLALSCLNLPSSISEGSNSNLQLLMSVAKSFISKNFNLHYEEALELTLESIEKILSWDALEVDSEDKVYDFLLDWMRTHYSDLGERRKVYSSRLWRLVRFPHMSCEKLKVLLHNDELEQGDATKMVVEALLSKFGNHLTLADAKSTCQGRAYKLRLVDVIVPDSPHQECVVYTKLKKEEYISITKEDDVIRTQVFHVTNESFYLEFELRPGSKSLPRDFGISLVPCKRNSSTDHLELDFEVAVRLKTTGKFTAKWTGSRTLERGSGWWVRIGESWYSLMAEDSPYFDNGVLYVRISFALKQ